MAVLSVVRSVPPSEGKSSVPTPALKNETNVQQTENVIREIARLCYENSELD